MATCTIEYLCGCKSHFDRNDPWIAHRVKEGRCFYHQEKMIRVTFDPHQRIEELVPAAKRPPGMKPGGDG
jgi:hypothetical protein